MTILFDLIIIFFISTISLYISNRLNLPSILAFLLAGILVGPYGATLISTLEEVNTMAEIGILLLLFTIGIEFSLEKLLESKLYVLVGGSLQVLISVILFFGAAMIYGLNIHTSLFIGMLFAMSSTAIVLQIFQEKGWMNTLFGKNSVSILIFQDIIIIPMMLLIPFLGESGNQDLSAVKNIAIGFILVALVVLAARKIVPVLLRNIVHTGNQELFLMTIIVICFATAFGTYQLGLKLALGAFLAGLIISESEYSFEALKNVMPFKKVFTAIFFVSIGMLLNIQFLVENIGLIFLLTFAVMIGKLIIIFLISLTLKLGLRHALTSGLVLCQVGEFAFILSKAGMDMQLLSDFAYQAFLSISIISMIITALIMGISPKIADKIVRDIPWKAWIAKIDEKSCLPEPCGLVNHTVIIGFGPGGKRIATFLKEKKNTVAVIELNERNIHEEDKNYDQVIVGDAQELEVLRRAAIESAKQVIITIPDPAATEDITIKVRKMNHMAKIIVRTKYQDEVDQLYKLGADRVVPEEISVADSITGVLA